MKKSTDSTPTPTDECLSLTGTAARLEGTAKAQFSARCWAGDSQAALVKLAHDLGLPIDAAEQVKLDVDAARTIIAQAGKLSVSRRTAAAAREAVESLKKERAAFFAVYEPRAQEADWKLDTATRAEVAADRFTGELQSLASSKPWLIPDDHLPELIRLRLREQELSSALGPLVQIEQAAKTELEKRARDLTEHDASMKRTIGTGYGPFDLGGDPTREPANIQKRDRLSAAVDAAKARHAAAQAALDAARQPLAEIQAALAAA
jgi:hypothetical protein